MYDTEIIERIEMIKLGEDPDRLLHASEGKDMDLPRGILELMVRQWDHNESTVVWRFKLIKYMVLLLIIIFIIIKEMV